MPPISHIPPVALGCSLAHLGQVEGSAIGRGGVGGETGRAGSRDSSSGAAHRSWQLCPTQLQPHGCPIHRRSKLLETVPKLFQMSWKGCLPCHEPCPSRQGCDVGPLRHPSLRLQPDVGLVSSAEPSAVSVVASSRQGLAECIPNVPAWAFGHGEPAVPKKEVSKKKQVKADPYPWTGVRGTVAESTKDPSLASMQETSAAQGTPHARALSQEQVHHEGTGLLSVSSASSAELLGRCWCQRREFHQGCQQSLPCVASSSQAAQPAFPAPQSPCPPSL